MGSAGRLLPPPQSPAKLHDGSALAGRERSWLQSLWEGWQQRQHGSRAAVAADTPSQQRWQVAAGDVPGYETAPYSPPEVRTHKEVPRQCWPPRQPVPSASTLSVLVTCCLGPPAPQAILHLPATAAYDTWSAACLIYEAATGRVLFPLEAAAAERCDVLAASWVAVSRAAGTSIASTACQRTPPRAGSPSWHAAGSSRARRLAQLVAAAAAARLTMTGPRGWTACTWR
jgi:hypothetical protein